MDKLPFSIYDFFGYLASGFLICVAADHALGKSWLLQDKIPVLQGLFWVVAAYIVGHINANLSSWLLENLFVGKLLGRPNLILFTDKTSLPRLSRFLFPGYHTPLPKNLIERIMEKAKTRNISIDGEAFFHHTRTVSKNSKETWGRMDIFLQHYGFCRNASFALLLSAILLGLLAILSGGRTNGVLALAAFLASIGMLYRYLKFYRQYSYEMFTAYPDLVPGVDVKEK